MMCAGLEKGGADSCQVSLSFKWFDCNCVSLTKMCSFKISVFQGDSGGPLIIQRESKQHEIVGVVSWGKHIDNDTQSTNWLFLKNFGSKTLFIHTFHTQVLAVPDQIIPASIRE